MKFTEYKKIIYPVLFVVVIGGVLLVIILTAQFLSRALNISFSIDERTVQSGVVTLDKEGIQKIGGKFGVILLPSPQNEQSFPALQDNQEGSEVENIIIPSLQETMLDENVFRNEDITIRIYNGTKISGLAGSLKSKLEAGGFVVGGTGNASASLVEGLSTTRINIKKGREVYTSELVDIVKKEYPNTVTSLLDSIENDIDVEVVIGPQ